MRALHPEEYETLALAASPCERVVGQEFRDICERLAQDGFVESFTPTDPRCRWAFTITRRGVTALRIHATYLGISA